ncbi:AAA family ATPase [Shewanella sp. BF02_Schw]|uniref:ATP-dependent DNA helicase n=1 Tax=Shewanella sp. BF02_Schw TaxID=394908 RepID=UPI00177BEA0C|nr:ATP-dependent RecD-like DNA helicase [Shewanella sp. BF02_Schw]MBO1897689.1 AAA family ATPase [Shewanella sp. BF02_Schw]
MNDIKVLVERRRHKGSTATEISSIPSSLVGFKVFRGHVGYEEDFEVELSIHLELQRLHQSKGNHGNVKICHLDSLDDLQNKAIQNGIRYPVSFITGNAGSGKTRTIKELVLSLINEGVKSKEIVICSLLGVVANKLKHLTGLKAYTVNRLLEYKDVEGAFKPLKSESNKLDCKFLIVDEATLLCNELVLALLVAINSGTHLIMVGDISQVQSIQPGAFFYSVVQANAYPKVNLKSNYRNNQSQIENLSLDIIAPFGVSNIFDYVSNNLSIQQTDSDSDTALVIEKAISRAVDTGMELNQIQILTPVHQGSVGTLSINKLVSSAVGNQRGGLKVILKKTNYRLGLFNGQVGVCTRKQDLFSVIIQGKELCFDGVQHFDSTFELAYALTPHRVQGAEFDLVIVVIPFNCSLINTNWVYSAITRTKKSLVIVGDAKQLAKINADHRTTFLKLLTDSIENVIE